MGVCRLARIHFPNMRQAIAAGKNNMKRLRFHEIVDSGFTDKAPTVLLIFSAANHIDCAALRSCDEFRKRSSALDDGRVSVDIQCSSVALLSEFRCNALSDQPIIDVVEMRS